MLRAGLQGESYPACVASAASAAYPLAKRLPRATI
jgi:hypothetical protein